MIASGTCIALTDKGPLYLRRGWDHEFSAPTPPSLAIAGRSANIDHGYVHAFDVAVSGSRVVALCEGQRGSRTVAITTLALDPLEQVDVPSKLYRVAITDDRVFVATLSEVTALGVREPLVRGAIDLAATSSRLAIAMDDGVAWFEADGRPAGRTALSGPTAMAVDRCEPGWLVAADGGVFHLGGPGLPPRLVAPYAERILKLRRGPDAFYVAVERPAGRELPGVSAAARPSLSLRAIAGERVEEVVRLYDGNDFDAGPEGLVRI